MFLRHDHCTTYHLIDSFINFRQSYYAINENTEFVQVEIIFSNPVSFDFTVMITHNDTSATGKAPLC